MEEKIVFEEMTGECRRDEGVMPESAPDVEEGSDLGRNWRGECRGKSCDVRIF